MNFGIKQNILVGLMLFALFLGAGNIIFPPVLGQEAGMNLPGAMIGFLITGVGLPLLAVIAIAKSGSDFELIASRVHPLFGLIFTMVVYLTIGPFFGIPRTATVSYEIGIIPFLPDKEASGLSLALFTIVFFLITLVLALNPKRIVDTIGKILTPILLIVIALLAIKSVLTPMGELQEPVQAFESQALFQGFVKGYLTIDVIAALAFGIVVVKTLEAHHVREPKAMVKATIIAGIIAAIGLTFVYISLAYIGGTSVGQIGYLDNGGAILSNASTILYGKYGATILALTIIFACITTSIGLVTACSQYFQKVYPKISYKTYAVIFTVFSTVVANVGLSTLIKISTPVLLFIYPLAIVLIVLSFIDEYFDRQPIVYTIPLILTGIVSIFDALAELNITIVKVDQLFGYLPLYAQGIGWIVPAIIGTIIGIILTKLRKTR